MRRVIWVGSSLDDLRGFPDEVKDEMGFAIYRAQCGGKHPDARPLRGYGGAGVLEIAESHDGDTYRCVYTVRFEEAVYVLHAFQKKSTHGIETPGKEIRIVEMRLKRADELHRGRG